VTAFLRFFTMEKALDKLFSLNNKVALITGGLGQLGLEYVHALVEREARVAIIDMSDDEVLVNDERFSPFLDKGLISSFKVDVTIREEIEVALQKVTRDMDIPHILINNAGLDSPPDSQSSAAVGSFEDYPDSIYDQIMNVNVKGTFLCCQSIGRAMANEGRGSIINISSIYGLVSPRQKIYEFRRKKGEEYYKPFPYSVSKSAIFNLTRYLATYWAESGVRVNTLTLAGVYNNQPDEFVHSYCEHVPLGRMANLQECIGPLIFLASDASSYVTGSNLIVDGGYTAW